MTGIYIPKTYDLEPAHRLIFLAGPINWGGSWQLEAARYIFDRSGDIDVAMPLRELPDDLRERHIKGELVAARQLKWEQEMIEIAASRGGLLFWCPKRSDSPVPNGRSKTYARDTRGELGAWMTEAKYRKEVRLVIAGEEEFDGFDVIKRNAMDKMGLSEESFPSKLRDACDMVIDQVHSR